MRHISLENRWNKTLSLILCVVLAVLLLGGCATKESDTSRENVPSGTGSVSTDEPNPTEKASSAEEPSPGDEPVQEETQPSGSHILVAYFSATGHTAPLAEYAAEILGADLYEIIAEDPYTEADLAYYTGGRCDQEQDDPSVRPAIAGTVDNMNQYDVVLIGHPIWHGQAPRIINTFLESYDFSGKTLVTFCTSASSGLGSSAGNLYGLVPESVKWLESRRFPIGASKEEVLGWLEEIGLTESEQTEKATMQMRIGDTPVTVQWEENESVSALMDLLREKPLTVAMSMYGGFEQVGSLGKSLPRDDQQTTTSAGDIVLYSGNQIVVFYGSKSWSYTRLGHVELSAAEMSDLLSHGDVTIALSIE